MRQPGFGGMVVMVARGILRARVLRRKMIFQLLAVLLLLLVLGTWVMEDWLSGSLVIFGLFWGGVGLFSVMLGLLCVYDMLSTFKELREEDRNE